MMREENFYSKLIEKREKKILRLQNKKMPMISVDQHSNTIKFIRPGQDYQISAARTSEPFQPHSSIAYFQAKIINCRRKNDIGIGLVHKGSPLKKHPGQSKNSFGYLSSGEIYFHRQRIATNQPFAKGDTIGIGVDYCQKEIFITLNGLIIKNKIAGYEQIGWKKFYPCVSVHHQGQQVQLIFDENKLLYNYKHHLLKAEEKIFKQIKEEKCDLNSMYSMVADYLSFNGYTNSYKLLKQSKGEEIKDPVYCKNPEGEKLIDLKNNLLSSELSDLQNLPQNEELSLDQINQNTLPFKRHRIMSDYWGYMVPNELPRKNTIQEERLLLDSRRKSSYISNQESMVRLKSENIEIEEGSNQIDIVTENFLRETRVEIIVNIREQKLQQAMTLITQMLPQLFLINDLLGIYFKMHIFLRKIKRQGSQSAIFYARQNNKQFLKYKTAKFPKYSYSQKRLIFVKFQQILGTLRFEGKQNGALSSKQFECFSEYVNELILKSLGYFSDSKLGVLFNHLKAIENRNQLHEVNGPLFEIEN